MGTKCLDLAEEGERVAKVHTILRSLNFKSIEARQSTVKEAHKKTFNWIFKEVDNDVKPQPRFLTWLREGKGIYWVSGKAGSGKSTLMKLLCSHTDTKEALKTWAGGEKLVTASYFFWSAGNDMQKSQQGLLRSFLFQILSQCPDRIPTVFLSRCSVNDSDIIGDLWTLQELVGCFETLAKQDLLSAKFCFFVDGLDEYDGEDIDVIKTIQDMVISSKVKICASSRPWNAFEKAFGDNREQKLLLQDYTRGDIRLYVTKTFEKNKSFKTLSLIDSQYKQLIEEIVQRAQGVFLWVYLVVRSLLRGLTDDNDISFMHKRLGSLPIDLEDYFKQMMETIEDIYQEQTAQIFQLVVHAKSPLSAVAFWFFAKEKANPNYAIEAEIKSLDDREVGLISERMRTHLNACCKDLLEVNVNQSADLNFLSYQVNFLHRTVRDFLMTKDMHIMLRNRTGPDFDARVSLCKLSLAQVKALPNLPRSQGLAAQVRALAEQLLCDTINYAYQAEIHNGVAEYMLLNELDRSITVYLNFQKPPGSQGGLDSKGNLGVFRNYDADKFVSLVTAAGLSLYISQRVDSRPTLFQKASQKRLLLEIVINGLPDTISVRNFPREERDFDVEMARVLFARGADPNSQAGWDADNYTIWHSFLGHCTRKFEQTTSNENLFQMAELFICHGANFDIRIHGAIIPGKESYSPLEILKKTLSQSKYECIKALATQKSSAKLPLWRRSWLSWK